LTIFNRAWISLGAACMVAAMSPGAGAVSTQAVRDESFKTLQQGEFEGVALSSDGFLYPAYARRSLADTGAEIVWSVLEQGDRGVLCATGHGGKLFRIDGGGSVHEIASVDETELTAMVALPDGSVLVAAAPGAQIYRLTPEDELQPYVKLDAKFVWSMTRDDSGNVFAATGTDGRLFRILTRRGEVEVQETLKLPSTNLIDLWIDADGLMGHRGALFIAGERPGYLYRYVGRPDETEVLYDAQSDEIRAIAATPEGMVIATNTERAPTPQALNLTLRMSGAPQRGEGGNGGAPGAQAPRAQQESDMGDVFEQGERKPQAPVSRVLLLRPDGFADELWASPERPIHDLSPTPDGKLLVAAGGRGRVFEIENDRNFALVADMKEDFVIGLTPTSGGWLAHTARNGVVFRIDHAPADAAVYRSRVIGSNGPVRWGKFYWQGETGDGQRLTVAFRQGNALDPDQGSWQPWTPEQEIVPDAEILIPPGPSRYLQYRLTMHPGRKGAAAFRTDYVEAFYQGENRAPRLRDLSIIEPGVAQESGGGSAQGAAQAQQQPGKADGAGAESGTQANGRGAHSNLGIIQVNWTATDPDSDQLEFALYFKGQDEAEWKLIEDELQQSSLPLQVKGIADGRYRFKVIASDRPANPPGAGLTDVLVSDEVVVDNTPPRVEDLRVVLEGNRARLLLRAVDAVSLVASVEIDIDNGQVYPLFPVDGLFDSRTEEIDWLSMPLDPGERVITVAVTDRRGNTSVRKAVFFIAE
jgi:hypothetical protein